MFRIGGELDLPGREPHDSPVAIVNPFESS